MEESKGNGVTMEGSKGKGVTMEGSKGKWGDNGRI